MAGAESRGSVALGSHQLWAHPPGGGYRVGAGGAWLDGVSLSCLWLPGAKQGVFPCVLLRDDRPSPAPLGCGWPDTPGLPSSLPFPGEAWPARPWPPWAPSHRASVHLCDSEQSGHYVLRSLPGPPARHVPPVWSGPRRGAVRLLRQGPVCPATDAGRPSPPPGPRPPGPDLLTGLSQGGPPSPRGGALCQGRAVP